MSGRGRRPVGPPTNWRVPERTVIIATEARSGSNLLCDLMAQTGRLGQPSEYFSPYVLAEDHPGRGQTTEDRCWLTVEAGSSSNGVVGLKLFSDHFDDLLRDVHFSQWFGRPKWIRLKRADVVAQAISFVAAMQRRSFKTSQPIRGELTYDPEWAANIVTSIYQQYALWDAYFARMGIEPLDLAYEEVQSDPQETIRRVGAFVGVDVGDLQLDPGRVYRVQRTTENDAFRQRLIGEYADPDIFRKEARVGSRRERIGRALRMLRTGL